MLFNEDFEVIDEVATYWSLDLSALSAYGGYTFEETAKDFLSQCNEEVRRLIVEEYGEDHDAN